MLIKLPLPQLQAGLQARQTGLGEGPSDAGSGLCRGDLEEEAEERGRRRFSWRHWQGLDKHQPAAPAPEFKGLKVRKHSSSTRRFLSVLFRGQTFCFLKKSMNFLRMECTAWSLQLTTLSPVFESC